jgi:hypothetical protein
MFECDFLQVKQCIKAVKQRAAGQTECLLNILRYEVDYLLSVSIVFHCLTDARPSNSGKMSVGIFIYDAYLEISA